MGGYEPSQLNSENASLSQSSENNVKRITGGGLKVCCLNVNSLLKHIDQLRLLCETHKPHVLCLNETKLDNEIRDEDLVIEIDGKDRDRYGGGVAMFVSEEIKFFKREDLKTDFESLTVELDIQYVKPTLITTAYRPPDSLVDLFDKVQSLT